MRNKELKRENHKQISAYVFFSQLVLRLLPANALPHASPGCLAVRAQSVRESCLFSLTARYRRISQAGPFSHQWKDILNCVPYFPKSFIIIQKG
jgi:hypothetical protein